MLEDRSVVALHRTASGFVLHLQDGEEVMARRVIVAVGISYFQHVPAELSHLTGTFLSHSSGHHTLDHFKDREITVIGGGSSALDVAALLLQAGAKPQLLVRGPKLSFQEPPEEKPRSLLTRLRSPRSGLGTGWRSRLCTDMPLVFYRMPQGFRMNVVKTHLGPAPCWFTKDQVEGRLPVHLRTAIKKTEIHQNRLHLQLSGPDGKDREIETDHIIAGTGYKVDLGRIPFLNRELRSEIRAVNDTPVLSTNFESSVPGLHFVGASAANSFGPLVRFAYGAGFTAKRMSRYLQAAN
jgi:thioredoxin reductase